MQLDGDDDHRFYGSLGKKSWVPGLYTILAVIASYLVYLTHSDPHLELTEQL